MLSKNGNFCGTEFSTVSEKLCDDLCEIVHTLGGIVRKKKRKSFYKKNGERIECRLSYRLNIKLPKGMNPFRLKRKSDRYNEPQKYQTGRYISKIEKQGEYECTCISVDSVDNLYVAEHCIVTHNTTTAVVASIESNTNKVLVICPASLKINWKRELENYTDKSISIVEGKKWEDADYVIINYDILKNFHTLEKDSESIIRDAKFDLVIVDEAHAICNVQAQRTKLVNDISKISQRTWLLTGTPVTSRPINYFNLLNLVDCNVAQNWMAYVKRYCNGYQFRAGNRKIWNVSGASNLEELYERTKPFVLRRLKNDVLDLPEKIISPIYMRLKSREYEEVMGEYYEWYDKGGESNSLTMQFSKIVKVRQIIANEKVSQTIELCENILDQDKKVIIFCNFTESLNTIYSHFKKIAVKLDGSTPKGERQDAVDKFQTDEKVKVFVGNIKAAGVGLTLTAAETVIMNDLSFLPSDHSQAEDRAYRYGQKNNVVVYYPIFENTIEGIIYDILDKKKRIINTVMGDTMLFEGDALENILQSINQNRN
jgi:SWI/SNF-related matrix-associated actin-dependent regulator 1 of chromatin subfamily A